MVFTDPFITLHELPRIRLWEELRDHIIDRRKLSWLVRAWGYDPYPPTIPSAGEAVRRLTYATGCCRQHIDWVGEELIDKDHMVQGPDIPQLKTVAKLHLDAFGYDSTGWDDPAAPPVLTYPCTMHYRAWDDIRKMVLEVDKHWYTYPYQEGFATLSRRAGYWKYDPATNPRFDSWTEAKQNALGNMQPNGDMPYYVGRRMHGYRYPDGTQRYICDAWGMEKYYGEGLFGWDLSGLIETPVLSRVFIAIRWTPNLGTYYRSPIPVDIYIGGFKCNSAPLELEGTTEQTKFYLFELDNFNQSNYTFDGTKYDIDVRFADNLNGWVDDAEFPAPGLGEHTYWYQQAIGYDGWQDPDQLAVKMFYFFTWP